MTSFATMNCVRMSESEESGGSGDARPKDWESVSNLSKGFTKASAPSLTTHHVFPAHYIPSGHPKPPTIPDFDDESHGCSCINKNCTCECESVSLEPINAPPPSIPMVPDFDDDETGCNCPACTYRETSELYTTDGPLEGLFNENLMSSLLQYFSCPICHDPMTEATAASCGHAFCSSCLQTWLKKKPLCPICSKEVTCCIRQFNVDHVIEDAVRELSKDDTTDDTMIADLSRSINQAAAQRSKAVTEESMKFRILNNLRQKMDHVKNVYHCKGYTGIFTTASHSNFITGIKQRLANISSRSNVSCTPATVTPNCTAQDVPNQCGQVEQQSTLLFRRCKELAFVASGVLIAVTYMNLSNCTQFFRYCLLCLNNYDGHIPSYLLNSGDLAAETAPIPPSLPSPPSSSLFGWKW